MKNPDVLQLLKNLDVVIYGVLVVVFWALHILIRVAIHYVEDHGCASLDIQAQMSRRARIICAQAGDKFASLLISASIGLTIALGMYKFFKSVANFLLPDHTLGVTLLVAFCSIFVSFQLVWPEIRATWKVFQPNERSKIVMTDAM